MQIFNDVATQYGVILNYFIFCWVIIIIIIYLFNIALLTMLKDNKRKKRKQIKQTTKIPIQLVLCIKYN